MPNFSPTDVLDQARARRMAGQPPPDMLEGGSPLPPESPPRSPGYRKVPPLMLLEVTPRRPRPSLWSRLVQHLCPHPTTTSARVPGAIPPVYQCHCWSCDRRWAEAGE